jgi:autotransporter translocation and assembly factor TamB
MFIRLFNAIKRTLKLGATLGFAAFVFGLYLLFTAHGSEVLLAIVSEMTPYKITYEHFSGYLARQAHFKGLSISGPNLQVHASTLYARWNVVDLLKPTKTVQALEAEGFKLAYQGRKMPTQAARSLLPFPFIVEDLSLTQAHFTINEDKHDVTRLQLKRASSDDLASIQEIHYQGTFGQVDVILNQAIEANWDLHCVDAPFLRPYLSGRVASKGHIVLPKRKWRDPNNEVQIEIQGDHSHIESYSINHFKLTLNGTLARHRATLQGKLNTIPFTTDFSGKLSASKWQGTIQKIVFNHPSSEGLGSSSGKINLAWDQNAVLAELDFLLGEKQPIQAQINISKDPTHTLSGKITATIKQLRSLSVLFPELRRVRGSAECELNLSGALNDVKYSGQMNLSNLRITAPVLKSKAVISQLQLTLTETEALTLQGQGTFGNGSFSLDGMGTLKEDNAFLKVHLKGEQLLLSDTPEYYIVGNPNLSLTLHKSGAKLEGSIVVPHAEIRSLKNPNTVSPSEDVVIVTHKTVSRQPSPTYSLAHSLSTNIDIILGDKISYDGYGIKTQAKGQINIKQTPGQPTKAKGRITLVKGKYRAYGKRFNIAEGELLFTGGVIDNPTLNIRAERKIKTSPSAKTFHAQNEITAGVKFAGPIKDAHIEFYSNPPLSSADIISYLVVGQPQSQMNQAQAELLFQALSQLTVFGGKKRSDVQLSLAEQLKLDQFGFAKKDNLLGTTSKNPFEDTVFVLGKQLSDRLYLHYSLGLVDSSNNIGLRYFMGKNLTLEASTGTDGTSADLLLTLEGH